MEIHEEIRQYIKDYTEDFDTKPDSISVSEYVDYDTGEYKNLEVQGIWKSDNDLEIPDRRTIRETKSASFYDTIYNKIQDLRSNVNLSEGRIKHVTIRQSTINEGGMDEWVDNYPFYTKKDSKYNSMIYVESEREPTERVTSHIKNYVQSELTEFEPDISKEQIVEIELAYDDFAECKLISISGYVITENPHKYYSDVDSFEEYATRLGKRDGYEYDELVNKENHRVFYRIDDYESEEKPDEYSKKLEPLMMKEMNSIASIKREFMFEAEAIVITDYTPYDNYEPKQYGYTKSRRSEYISFYVRQPVSELT